MENKTKKHVDALKSLHLSNKINGIKQTESIFPQNQFNDLIIDKLKEIKQLQNNIKLDNNIYNIQHKEENIMFLINIHYLLLFKRYDKEHLALEDADEEQSMLVKKLSNLNRGKIPAEKSLF